MIIEERKSEWSLWRVTISCPFTHTIIIISVIIIIASSININISSIITVVSQNHRLKVVKIKFHLATVIVQIIIIVSK